MARRIVVRIEQKSSKITTNIRSSAGLLRHQYIGNRVGSGGFVPRLRPIQHAAQTTTDDGYTVSTSSGLAQRKRVGPITQRSADQNRQPLSAGTGTTPTPAHIIFTTPSLICPNTLDCHNLRHACEAQNTTDDGYTVSTSSGLAQRKRVGPITQRSADQNRQPLSTDPCRHWH